MTQIHGTPVSMSPSVARRGSITRSTPSASAVTGVKSVTPTERHTQRHAHNEDTGGRRRLLTAHEASDLLRTTRKAVYAMVERGQIPGVVRLGRRVLFWEHALLDWLGQKSSPSLER